MKYYASILSIILSLISLSSCYQDFEPDGGDKKILVLNSVAKNDLPIKVKLSRTYKYTENQNDYTVKDANVIITVNGEYTEKLDFDDNTQCYISEYIASVGDYIQIKADSRSYGSAYGSTTITTPITIEKIDCNTTEEIDPNGFIYTSENGVITVKNIVNICTHIQLTFKDDPNQTNYYMLELKHSPNGDKIFKNNIDISEEPIFTIQESVIDKVLYSFDDYYIFTDESINGKEYTLRFTQYVESDLFSDVPHIIDYISISTLSEEYYKYLLSLHKKYSGLNNTLENLGLAEQLSIYSNVEPGTGIVGALSSKYEEFDLYPYLLKHKDKFVK